MKYRSRLLYILMLTLLVSGSSEVVAQPDPSTAATELYGTTMSPYCPGVTLSACTSEDALVLREEILASIRGGASIEQVRESLIKRFGSEVLGLPDTAGFGIVAWVLPPLASVLGALALFIFLRRQIPSAALGDNPRANRSIEELEQAVVPEDVREQIEREVRERLG